MTEKLTEAAKGYDIYLGTDPVDLTGVSARPAPGKLSWIKKPLASCVELRGVVVASTLGNRILIEDRYRATLIIADNPRLAFARIAKALFPPKDTKNGPNWVGRAGFGWIRNEEGKLEHFPHYGTVKIGENVDIGSFTCIDRGALTDTIIEDGVKIDNLVHIAHGAHIGEHTTIAALTCIEGSVKIGKRCTIGSNVTFQIGSGCGDDVTVGSGSVVTKHIPSGETWIGVPAKQI